MRKILRLAVGSVCLCASLAAQGLNDLPTVSKDDAQTEVSSIPYNSNLSLAIWSDKYVYEAGQQLSLRWTVKTNGDSFPYTVVAYRQNNQTGAKTYLPGGNSDVTDIFGNKVGEFKIVRMADRTKGVVIGDNGLLPASLGSIPSEFGMHTIVVQLRDYSGGRIIKSAYMKIGVVEGFEDLTGNIESTRTLTNRKAYRLRGVVAIRNNATLNIEPGTFILGQPGSQPPSVLLVTRNGKINAYGTRSRPIVMTSSQNFGDRQRGDWGGLIMLGRAPINVAANSGTAQNQAGEFFIEGLPASEDTAYGGADANHDCGRLSYVRVEYAGSIFAPNNEANSFTWGGCGKGTLADHLQAIYGLDDSFEWFGGNMDAKYLVGGLGADDYVDYQLGYTGRIQYGVFYQNSDNRGNRGIEGDNSEYNQAATPLSKPVMYNLTFIGSGETGFDEANSPGIYLRRGAGAEIYNTVVTNFASPGLFVDGAATQAQIDAGNIKMDGILLWNNNKSEELNPQVDTPTRDFAAGTRGQGRQILAMNPMIRRGNDLLDPDFRPMLNSPCFQARWVQPPDDGFFDQGATFIGGVGSDNWLEEWTNFLQDVDIKP